MPTYQFEEHGFEMDFPADWSVMTGISRLPLVLANAIQRANVLQEFSRGSEEYLNVTVEQFGLEPPPDLNELMMRVNAHDMKYTDLEFGRIAVGGRPHAWCRYVFQSAVLSKKYLIVLNGTGYAITASCLTKELHATSESAWDNIATSLRLLKPLDEAIAAFNDTLRARQAIQKLREMWKTRLEEQKHR